jgi:hypothetical protein
VGDFSQFWRGTARGQEPLRGGISFRLKIVARAGTAVCLAPDSEPRYSPQWANGGLLDGGGGQGQALGKYTGHVMLPASIERLPWLSRSSRSNNPTGTAAEYGSLIGIRLTQMALPARHAAGRGGLPPRRGFGIRATRGGIELTCGR